MVTQQAYNNAVAIGKSVNGDENADIQPPLNPPYTPKLKSFTADYTASFEIDINADLAGENIVYHINAFGYNVPVMQAAGGPGWIYFLPQFENEGELYIGIDNISAPQNLSLFFQLAEGSADPDLAKPQVNWSYLSNNQWQPLQAIVLFTIQPGNYLIVELLNLLSLQTLPVPTHCLLKTCIGSGLLLLKMWMRFRM